MYNNICQDILETFVNRQLTTVHHRPVITMPNVLILEAHLNAIVAMVSFFVNISHINGRSSQINHYHEI